MGTKSLCKEEEDILCAPTGEAEPQVERMDARRKADVASRQSGIHRHPQERLLLSHSLVWEQATNVWANSCSLGGSAGQKRAF